MAGSPDLRVRLVLDPELESEAVVFRRSEGQLACGPIAHARTLRRLWPRPEPAFEADLDEGRDAPPEGFR